MRIKCLASDLGNVIIDFDRNRMIRQFADILNFSPDKVLDMFLRSGLARQYETGNISTDDFLQEVSKMTNGEISYQDFMKIWSGSFTLIKDYFDFLLSVKDKVKLIMVSNTNELHYGYIKQNFPEIMIFDAYFLSYEMHSMKPDAEYYQHFIRESGFKSDEILFIDDKKENIKTAESIGLNTIQYQNFADFKSKLKAFTF